MYNNESAGPALEEFLDLLGQRVRLKGFTKYRAQLDNKSKSKKKMQRELKSPRVQATRTLLILLSADVFPPVFFTFLGGPKLLCFSLNLRIFNLPFDDIIASYGTHLAFILLLFFFGRLFLRPQLTRVPSPVLQRTPQALTRSTPPTRTMS